MGTISNRCDAMLHHAKDKENVMGIEMCIIISVGLVCSTIIGRTLIQESAAMGRMEAHIESKSESE